MVTPGISAALVLMALGANVVGASVPWDAALQVPLELPPIDLTNIDRGEVLVYTTSKAGDRLRESRHRVTPVLADGTRSGKRGTVIRIEPSQTFQEILGFGGALTDAVAINLGKLPVGTRAAILDMCFNSNGTLHYSMARVPIGSCDFSTHVYSYDETEGDLSLSDFDMSEDYRSGKMQLVKDVVARRPDVRLFGSPWSAPAWMKTSQSQVGGELMGPVGGEYHQAWALYFSKFLRAYASENVSFWAVTAQNEPQTTGKSPWAWQSMAFTPETQRDFIKLALGPRLAQDHPDVRIIMLDDERKRLPEWTTTVMADPVAASYVSGVGVHWYDELEATIDHFALLSTTHTAYPDLFLLPTEACNGYMPPRGPRPGYWRYGEAYGHDILNDLNNYAAGWVDWNILLDTEGGPNWAGNVVDAPILVDTKKGSGRWYLNPSFFYLSHFSRFIQPGARRVGLDISDAPMFSRVEGTAFVNTDGLLVVVIINRGLHEHQCHLELAGLGYVQMSVPRRGIQTVVYRLGSENARGPLLEATEAS